jgi:hypothetical protein
MQHVEKLHLRGHFLYSGDMHVVLKGLEAMRPCRVSTYYLRIVFPLLLNHFWIPYVEYALIRKYNIGVGSFTGSELFYRHQMRQIQNNNQDVNQGYNVYVVPLEVGNPEFRFEPTCKVELPGNVSCLVSQSFKERGKEKRKIYKWMDEARTTLELKNIIIPDLCELVVDYVREEISWEDFQFDLLLYTY